LLLVLMNGRPRSSAGSRESRGTTAPRPASDPFDLARVINIGRRVFGSGTGNPEFGLKQNGEPAEYNFPAGLARSMALLATLETGVDPVWRKGGETVRHYHMPEADEILPYHVFVPSTWNGTSSLPLMFILHGNSRDQDFYFDRDEWIIPRTAEKHGYMVVAPLGYSPNGGYNYVPYGRETVGARGLAGAAASPQLFGPADKSASAQAGRGRIAGFGGVNGPVTRGAPSSSATRQADRARITSGRKFAGTWAAIAIGGSNAQPAETYPYDTLRRVPMLTRTRR
jgi:hypothetical protein